MPSLPEPLLSADERSKLLQFARQAVTGAVSRSGFVSPPGERALSRVCGVFVTVRVAGKLRGCIGVVEATEPLRESIAHCAAAAALHDPRFPPVRPEELDRIGIEISLLSPPEPILPTDIVLGRHGLVVARERQRGLLLPQVATEHQLSREDFLAETCRKAGLPPDAWKSGSAQILGFTCEVFSDHTEAGTN